MNRTGFRPLACRRPRCLTGVMGGSAVLDGTTFGGATLAGSISGLVLMPPRTKRSMMLVVVLTACALPRWGSARAGFELRPVSTMVFFETS